MKKQRKHNKISIIFLKWNKNGAKTHFLKKRRNDWLKNSYEKSVNKQSLFILICVFLLTFKSRHSHQKEQFSNCSFSFAKITQNARKRLKHWGFGNLGQSSWERLGKDKTRRKTAIFTVKCSHDCTLKTAVFLKKIKFSHTKLLSIYLWQWKIQVITKGRLLFCIIRLA